jgi:chromosomal replication initiator protein
VPAPEITLPPQVKPIAPSLKRHPMEIIQRAIAAAYGLELVELLAPRRTRQFVRSRQVAMYLCSKLLPVSLPQIGRRFGDRDHTTVLHAIRKVEELRRTDLKFEFELQKMMDDLREILA